MYREKILKHSYIHSIWEAHISDSSAVLSEPANVRWGFAFKEYVDGTRGAFVLGPSAQFYKFSEESESYRCWGVELHEFVVAKALKKQSLQGVVSELTCSNDFFKLGNARYAIPTYDDLVSFVEKLYESGAIHVDEAAKSYLRGRSQRSVRTRQRVIRQSTGLTAKQINQIDRVNQAISLLQSGKPIPAIAADLGFVDQSHLTKSVKKITAKTPRYFTQHP